MRHEEEVETLGTPDGLRPCNGWLLVKEEGDRIDLIVVRHSRPDLHKGILVAQGPPEPEEEPDPWDLGDILFFVKWLELEGYLAVHWSDVVAYRSLR